MPSELMNDDALYFQCTQCGQCCHGYGGTYVSEADIVAIAGYLGRSSAEVRRQCCTVSGSQLVLSQRPDGYCVFFERNCTIHPVKPRMCRRWPFIPGLLKDIANWPVMADNCPGIYPDVDLNRLRAYVKMRLADAP